MVRFQSRPQASYFTPTPTQKDQKMKYDADKIEKKIGSIMRKAFELVVVGRQPVAKKSKKSKPKFQHRMGPGRPRPSGFPYCPIRHVYKDLVEEQVDLESDFYTSVGSAAHVALQRFMGLTGHMIGDYGCPVCGHSSIRKDPYCPVCAESGKRVECEYRELEGIYSEVYAHGDGILDLGKYGLWVIDYKTTATRMLNSELLPYLKNQYQCAAYVPIFERVLQRPIAGFALIYVARDKPKRFKVFAQPMGPKSKQQSLERSLDYSKQALLAHKYSTEPSKALLKEIVALKPCTSWEVHTELGHASCVLASQCMRVKPDNDRKLIQALLDLK